MGGKSSGSIERPPCGASVGRYWIMPNDTGVSAGGDIGKAVPIRQQIRFAQAGVLSMQGMGSAGADPAGSKSVLMSIFMPIGQGCGAVCAKADTQDAPTNASSSSARRTVRRAEERMTSFYGSSRKAQDQLDRVAVARFPDQPCHDRGDPSRPWELLRDSGDLALNAVSCGIDPAELRSFLQAQLGVAEIHDLHICAISTTETALTVHLVRPAAALKDGLPARLRQDLHERFKIAYARSRSRLASLARGRRPTRLAQP